MMSLLLKYGRIAMLVLVACSCIEPYDPPLNDSNMNFLVVEAFLNGTDGIATVKLSRSLPVRSSDPIPVVEGATVQIEREGGSIHSLAHFEAGVYTGQIPNPATGARYRLIVRADDEHEYASDFTSLLATPPIDSITWSAHRDGIQFEVNAHDATGNTKYVKWDYTETYEYQSKLPSYFMFESEGIVVERPRELWIMDCWKTDHSTSIVIGSLTHLQTSTLRKHPVAIVPYGSRKLFKRYHIVIRQQALTEETYNYWHNLARSTENLGGLFDPLPSEVRGNIHCTRHPGESALGLFSAAVVTEREFFLRRSELTSDLIVRFLDQTYCPPDTIWMEDLPLIHPNTLLADEIFGLGPEPVGYTSSTPSCIDCRYWGGTTTKPPFWE